MKIKIMFEILSGLVLIVSSSNGVKDFILEKARNRQISTVANLLSMKSIVYFMM